MNKTVLVLAAFFAANTLATPAAAMEPLVVVNTPSGERAMIVLNPQAPAGVWDGANWNAGPTGTLWQESEDDRQYCALRGFMRPIIGLSSTLGCSVPGGIWGTIAPPAGLRYGVDNRELSLSITPQGLVIIDALFDVSVDEKQWWSFSHGVWGFVLGGIPADEDVGFDSHGTGACAVWNDSYSGNIQTACDWSGNRALGIPFTINQITAPQADWVSGLVITSAGFAAVAWHNATGGFETAAIFDDGTVGSGPPGYTLVLGSDVWVAYNDNANPNGLHLWDPWGWDYPVYTWPRMGWATLAEHNGSVWVVEQDPRGRRGPLRVIYTP